MPVDLPMLQAVLGAPPPPSPPSPPRVTFIGGGESPMAVYRAQVAMRKELGDQLDHLQDTRRELAGQLADPETAGSARAGLEGRIASLDSRIAAVDKQIASADAEVAKAAGIPGAVVPDPEPERSGPPEEAFGVGALFIVCAVLPISIAYARRVWRRSAGVVSALPQEVIDRLTRLDQAVDAIAVEVERIGEGQRFVTRVLAERPASAALGASEHRAGGALEQREPR